MEFIKRFKNRCKIKYEVAVAKGILAEIMKKADWDMDNLNIIEQREAQKLIDMISLVENQLKCN